MTSSINFRNIKLKNSVVFQFMFQNNYWYILKTTTLLNKKTTKYCRNAIMLFICKQTFF